MKTRHLFYAIALFAGSFACGNAAQAQDVFVDDAVSVTDFTCDNTNHYFSSWRDNWFIELSAGGNQPFVENGIYVNPDNASPIVEAKKWTAAYSLGVGRWFNPYWGFRFKTMYGAIHWNNALYDQDTELGWSKMRHASLSLEFMWDMCNSIGGVNPKRVFSVIPFFGFGGDAAWKYRGNGPNGEPIAGCVQTIIDGQTVDKNVQWTLPLSAGIQFRFRLCKYVDFFAEARVYVYGDNWNNFVYSQSIDCLAQAMGGFNFNIGGRGWGTFNECNYVSQIAALNGQVNDLRAQLLACGQTVAALQAQLPCPEPVVQKDCVNAPLMSTVRFLINSAKILPTEEVNIYSMAEWLKANPKENIIIAGYADKDTGTAEYNMELSLRRAEAVKASLVEDYGIAPSRLTTKAFGSDVQEYPSHNDWNRIVIFKQ